jgi:hypothetical protein
MSKRFPPQNVPHAFLKAHGIKVKLNTKIGPAAWIAAFYTLGFPAAVGLLAFEKYSPYVAGAENWLVAGAILCASLAVILGWIGRRYTHRSLAIFAIVVGMLELMPGILLLHLLTATR